MGRYLNHSRHMDYTKNMAEHIYLTEKMKPTDKQKKFLYALRKKCDENGISHRTDRELKTRNNYKYEIDELIKRLQEKGLWEVNND